MSQNKFISETFEIPKNSDFKQIGYNNILGIESPLLYLINKKQQFISNQ